VAIVSRFGAAAACALALGAGSGCAPSAVAVPPNVTVGPSLPPAWPSPAVASNDAPPQIQAMHFSSLDVRRGQSWSAAFVTSSNVASVEVRNNLFSINVPRTGFGRFAFALDLLDTPPIFVRGYRLRVIARNSAGREAEEDMPMRIR